MSGNTKVMEEYYRVLANKPRSLDELSKKWRRLALLKLGLQENPIEVYSSEEDLKENSKENLVKELEDYSREHPSKDFELANKKNQVQKEV